MVKKIIEMVKKNKEMVKKITCIYYYWSDLQSKKEDPEYILIYAPIRYFYKVVDTITGLWPAI